MTIKTAARSLKEEKEINKNLLKELERLLAPEQPKSRRKAA